MARHLLLQVLGGEHEDALVVALRVAQHRVERRHRLAEAGGGLDQQVLALLERVVDALDDLELAGARRGVGEGQPLGGFAALLAEPALLFALADELAEPAADAGLDACRRHLEAQPLDRLGADLDQHQLDFDRLVLEARQHPGVDRRLALVDLAQQRRELPAAPHRLDLLDHQHAVLAAHAVDAADQVDLPARHHQR